MSLFSYFPLAAFYPKSREWSDYEKKTALKKDKNSTALLITWNSLYSHQLKQGSLLHCDVLSDFKKMRWEGKYTK